MTHHLPAPVAALILVVVLAIMTLVLPGAVAQEAGEVEEDEVGEVDAGRQVFAANCAACHGTTGEGAGSTPSVIGVVDRLTVEEVETIIRQGRGRMPAFEARLSESQVEDVLAFLAFAPEADDGAAAPRHGPHMDRWWDGMGRSGAVSGFMVLWMVFGLVLLVLLVAVIVWLLRRGSSDGDRATDHRAPPGPGPGPGPGSGSAPGSAREELDRRYARGEISGEEYRAIRDDLEA